MLLGVHKHGLDIRDVAPSSSFFKGVRVDRRRRHWTFTGSAGAGDAVDLLIHLPVVVVAGQHRRTRSTPTPRSPISTCWRGAPTPN